MRKWFCALLVVFISCSSPEESSLPDYSQLTQNELDTEFEIVNNALRRNVNDGDLYYKRSKLYMAMGDLQASLADMERAMRISPSKAIYHQQVGELAIRMNQLAQTESSFKECDVFLK